MICAVPVGVYTLHRDRSPYTYTIIHIHSSPCWLLHSLWSAVVKLAPCLLKYLTEWQHCKVTFSTCISVVFTLRQRSCEWNHMYPVQVLCSVTVDSIFFFCAPLLVWRVYFEASYYFRRKYSSNLNCSVSLCPIVILVTFGCKPQNYIYVKLL